MKSIFRKPFPFFLTLICLEAIVIIAVIVDALVDTSGWPVIAPVFRFLREWIIIISAIIVCPGVLFYFISARQSSRGSFLSKLHNMASEAVIRLAQYREEKADNDLQSGNFDGLLEIIDSLMVDSGGMLYDGFLDSAVRSCKKEVVDKLKNIKRKARRKDKSAFDELPRLQHHLADMMLLTFESTSGEAATPEK